jgi:LmbE family N-acetylglucosaminyl deacetylase
MLASNQEGLTSAVLGGGDGESFLEGLRQARVAVVVAHPDDEVIGAGCLLTELRNANLIHVTDGAPLDLCDAAAAGFRTREEYAEARRAELERALEFTRISPAGRRFMGLVDQEASLHLAALARELARVFEELRPEVVVTHPYEGGHPDHDATAFAVHAAVVTHRQKTGTNACPTLMEMTSYHERDGVRVTGEFLRNEGCEVVTREFSHEERGSKGKMLACFVTQERVLSWFPVVSERYRVAPRYDFTQPPHPGTLHYERFGWDMTGERWRALAKAALEELGLEGAI